MSEVNATGREMQCGSITFYTTMFDNIRKLPDNMRLALYDAIGEYEAYGIEPEFDDVVTESYFGVLKPGLDSIIKKKMGGDSGGRPKKKTTAEPPRHKPVPNDEPSRNLSETTQKPSRNLDVTSAKPSDNLDVTYEEPSSPQMVNGKCEMGNGKKSGGDPQTPLAADAAAPAPDEPLPFPTNPAVLEPDVPSEPAPKPKTRNKRELSPELQAWMDNVFWPAYPRKEGKKAFKTALAKLNPDEALRAEIMAGLERAMQGNEAFQKGDTPHIPHPTTWLNGTRWEDEFNAPAQPSSRASPPPGPQPVPGHTYTNDPDYIPPKPSFMSEERYQEILAQWDREHGGTQEDNACNP